jgi:hypothetical protein
MIIKLPNNNLGALFETELLGDYNSVNTISQL